MSEYIDREVAREYLHNACESIGGNGGLMLKIKFDEEPTADVRPNVHGEWIDYSSEGYVECPFCGSATNCDGNKEDLHFCFNCGADMRKGLEK